MTYIKPGVYKVSDGDARKLLAQLNANTRAQKRLAAFESKNHALTQAEARLRMFELETHLTENDAEQHRP